MERKLIAAAVSSALVLPMAAQAVEFAVSGHVARAIVSVDGGGPQGMPDANDGKAKHVDANSSQSRFTFAGSEELENGMTAGVFLQYGGIGPINSRHANVYLSTAGGKITVGHGSTATDGMAHADLGGLSNMGGVSNWCSYYGSTSVPGTGLVNGGPACPTNDGSRAGILRYDTPAIGPASIAVSSGDNDYWDIMLKVAGSFGDAGYDLRVGHIAEYDAVVDAVPSSITTVKGADLGKVLLKDDDAPDNLDTEANINQAIANHESLNVGTVLEQVAGSVTVDDISDDSYNKYVATVPATTRSAGDITTASAAVAFGQGTSIAVAWSQDQAVDGEYQYMKADHKYDGDSSVGFYYKRGETGSGMTKTEGSLWGVGIGHSIGGGADVYAGYRQISQDGMNDIDLLVAGMRVSFN